MRVDAGGYQLTAESVGDGSPTVVFSSGLGDGGEVWDGHYIHTDQPALVAEAIRTVIASTSR